MHTADIERISLPWYSCQLCPSSVDSFNSQMDVYPRICCGGRMSIACICDHRHSHPRAIPVITECGFLAGRYRFNKRESVAPTRNLPRTRQLVALNSVERSYVQRTSEKDQCDIASDHVLCCDDVDNRRITSDPITASCRSRKHTHRIWDPCPIVVVVCLQAVFVARMPQSVIESPWPKVAKFPEIGLYNPLLPPSTTRQPFSISEINRKVRDGIAKIVGHPHETLEFLT